MAPHPLAALALVALVAAATAHPADAAYPSNQATVTADNGVVTVAHSNAAFACTHNQVTDPVTPETTVTVTCVPPPAPLALHNACQEASTAVAGYGAQVGTEGNITIRPSPTGGVPTIGLPSPNATFVSGFIEATGACDDYASHTSAVAPSASWDHVAAYSDLSVQTCTVHVTGQLTFDDWTAACNIN